jgi:hypothetical protein
MNKTCFLPRKGYTIDGPLVPRLLEVTVISLKTRLVSLVGAASLLAMLVGAGKSW